MHRFDRLLLITTTNDHPLLDESLHLGQLLILRLQHQLELLQLEAALLTRVINHRQQLLPQLGLLLSLQFLEGLAQLADLEVFGVGAVFQLGELLVVGVI